MRTVPTREMLDVEFKSDVKCYSDHDLIEEIVGMAEYRWRDFVSRCRG